MQFMNADEKNAQHVQIQVKFPNKNNEVYQVMHCCSVTVD